MPEEQTYKIWTDKVFGTDKDAKERGITAPEDWRDPDEVLDLRNHRVVELEQTTADRRVVIQNDRGEHIDVQGWLEQQVGRTLVLPIIARDHQSHN